MNLPKISPSFLQLLKDLRTEVFRKMYEQPIHPKNLWLEQDPLPHEKVDEIYRENIRCLIKRGSFTGIKISLRCQQILTAPFSCAIHDVSIVYRNRGNALAVSVPENGLEVL